MRVLISVDLEGIAGVVSRDELSPGTAAWSTACEWMTDEANAAVLGVYKADPTAEILVCDAHARARNLRPQHLDPRCRMARGAPRRQGMLAGIDETFDAVMLVGCHARAGAEDAVLAHTFNGRSIAAVRIDGTDYGEIGLNVQLAEFYGARVVLVSGDLAATKEAEDLDRAIRTVTVKRALGANSIDTALPAAAATWIGEAALEALLDTPPSATSSKSIQVDLEVEVFRPEQIERALLIPGIQRRGARTVGYSELPLPAAYDLALLVADISDVG